VAKSMEFALPKQEKSPQPREQIELVLLLPDDKEEFTIREKTGQYVYTPTVEQIALFSRVGSKYCKDIDKMGGLFQFLEHITDDDSYTWITERFADPEHDIDLEWLTGFLTGMAGSYKEDGTSAEYEVRTPPKVKRSSAELVNVS
jgi:hypothetical protein